jgi:hypothetical protein
VSIYFFLVDLLGFKEGVFPGVFLLSLWRWSGFPVDVAVLFGPGLMASAGVKSGCCNNCRTAPQILGRPIRTVLREAHGGLMDYGRKLACVLHFFSDL